MQRMGIEMSDGRMTKPNWAEKMTMCGVSFVIVFMLTLFGIAAATLGVVDQRFDEVIASYPTTVTTVYTSLGLPSNEAKSWGDVTTASYGKPVQIWMYGPSAASTWVKGWLATQVSTILNSLQALVLPYLHPIKHPYKTF